MYLNKTSSLSIRIKHQVHYFKNILKYINYHNVYPLLTYVDM